MKLKYLPYVLLGLTAILSAIFLPLIPIDETRYLSVAWEIYFNKSFIVPLLNGAPYSHKPPLLFWLINIDWTIFGINQFSIRFIPLLFGFGTIYLTNKIAYKFWKNELIALISSLILASSFLFALWSSLVMFDVMLAFFGMLAFYNLILLSENEKGKHWLIISLSIGLGILTKGPVIFIHIFVPVLLYYFIVIKKENRPFGFGIKLFVSSLIGLVIASFWVAPAAILGGEEYRNAILWGQTVNRTVASFAHKRPFWFYLPLLPVLLLPYSFMGSFWSGFGKGLKDDKFKVLFYWSLAEVIIFSMISGKQIHYLIPIVPALSIITAKKLSGLKEIKMKRKIPVAIFYLLLAAFFMIFPFIKKGGDIGTVSPEMFVETSFILMGFALVVLILKYDKIEKFVITLSVFTPLVFWALFVLSGSQVLKMYDLEEISKKIKDYENRNYIILNEGEYKDQFHFLGRLKENIVEINNPSELEKFLNAERVIFLDYDSRKNFYRDEEFLSVYPYRNSKIWVLNKEGIKRYLERNKGKN